MEGCWRTQPDLRFLLLACVLQLVRLVPTVCRWRRLTLLLHVRDDDVCWAASEFESSLSCASDSMARRSACFKLLVANLRGPRMKTRSYKEEKKGGSRKERKQIASVRASESLSCFTGSAR
eukprot:751965-Hanusia_phi.AAC.2